MTRFTDWEKAYEAEMQMRTEEGFLTDDMTADLIDWGEMVDTEEGVFLVVEDATDTAEWIKAWKQYEDVFPEELEDAKAEGDRLVNIYEIEPPKN